MTTDSCSGKINGCCLCPGALLRVTTSCTYNLPWCIMGIYRPTSPSPCFWLLTQVFEKQTHRTHTCTQLEEGGLENLVQREHSVFWIWLMQMICFVLFCLLRADDNRWCHLVPQSVQVDTDHVYHSDQRKLIKSREISWCLVVFLI